MVKVPLEILHESRSILLDPLSLGRGQIQVTLWGRTAFSLQGTLLHLALHQPWISCQLSDSLVSMPALVVNV